MHTTSSFRLIQEFPFWDSHEYSYSELDRLFVKSDLIGIYSHIVGIIKQELLDIEDISWLDIGSGDGTTIARTVDILLNHSTTHRKVRLDCIEPQKSILPALKRNIQLSRAELRDVVISGAADASLLNKYDVITVIHSSYYFGKTENDFRNTWTKLLHALSPHGIIIVITLPEYSPFFYFAQPSTYISWSKGRAIVSSLCSYLQHLSVHHVSMRLATSNIISDDLEQTLRNLTLLYQFAHHDTNKLVTASDLSVLKGQLLATCIRDREWGPVVDFNDWVIWGKGFELKTNYRTVQ